MAPTPGSRPLVGLLIGVLALIGAGTASAAQLGNVSTSGSSVEVTGEAAGNNIAGTWEITPSATQVVVHVTGSNTLAGLSGCSGNGTSTVTCTGLSPGWELTANLSNTQVGQHLDILGSFAVVSTILGGAGADDLSGGAGTDRFIGLGGADVFAGEGGTDTADYTSVSDPTRTQGVNVTLDDVANDGSSPRDGTGVGGRGGDNVHSDVENVLGTEFADTLTGNGAANLLSGYGAGDTLTGNAGSDRLIGSFGNDTLYAEDGEADAEVNCNNSDGSVNEQPNTVTYDTGKDTPVNCNISTGGGSGGSSGGPVDGTTALQAGSIPSLERAGSWMIPAGMEPVFVKSGPGGKPRWDFTDFPSLRSASKDAPFPIRIERTYVGSSALPAAQRKFVNDGDIVSISPPGGTILAGSSRKPVTVSVKIYDELMDIRKGSCPYKGPAIGSKTLTQALNTSKGIALGSATRKLTTMRCQWTIATSRMADDSEPASISFIKSATVAKLGPSKYVVRLNVVHPRQGLDLIIGPRDPSTVADGGNRDFASRAAREMTLDDKGMLHQSARTTTTLSVQPLVRSLGKPVRSLTKVVLTAKDGSVLASQDAKTPNGVTTLSFTVPRTPYVTVRVTTTEEDGVSSLHGEKRIVVKGRSAPIRTVDGRCLKPAPREKWAIYACPAEAGSAEMARAHEAPAVTPLPYAVRWKIIDILLGGDGQAAPTRDRAIAICEAATPASAPGYRLVADQLGPSRCLADASMQALIREFKIVPALLGAKPDASCGGGLQAATAPISYQPAAAFVDGTLRSGTTPAARLDACGVLGAYMDGRFFVDQAHYLATQAAADGTTLINLDGGTLINLDGGTLINLDGGTLINLDGGTLINLDGGTLINLDGGTLQGAVLRGGDGLSWAAQTPPALISDRGAGLISDMGGAFVPVRIDPGLMDVGAGGLISKPRFP